MRDAHRRDRRARRAASRAAPGPVVVYANAATPRGRRAAGGRHACSARSRAPASSPSRRSFPCVRRRRGDARDDRRARRGGGRVRADASRSIGASTGAGLAILAAADPRLADRVTAVTAIAPFASLRDDPSARNDGALRRSAVRRRAARRVAAARSLAASAPDDPAVSALLANDDPARFDALYAELAPTTRALVDELSPLTRIADVRAPVELLSAARRRFFPVTSRARSQPPVATSGSP